MLSASLASLVACGGASERVEAATLPGGAQQASAPSFPENEPSPLKFHSLRFKLAVPLPDGHGWKVDDHSHRELLGVHAATRSTLTLFQSAEPELMNRQRCEARARELDLVPGGADRGALRTVDDAVTVGPEAYDTRVWVALEAGSKPGTPLVGHVMAFGAYIRKCLFVHFASEVSSDADEAVLSARLAVARLRIIGGITLEPFDEAPREHLAPR